MNNKIKNIIIFLIPIFIFMLLFLAYHPGIITFDGNNQWAQVQSGIINDAHPFFSTFFMLILSKIHNTTSIVLFYQFFVFSIIWTYICKITRKNKNDFYIQIVFTLILSFTPIISIYSITLWKDILYSYYLFGISAILYLGSNKRFNYNYFELILLAILLFLVFSYRHNGVIVAILLMVFLTILFKKYKHIKSIIVILLAFTTIYSITLIPKTIYLNKYNEKIDSKTIDTGTINNYIFWMYAAHLKDNNITSKDDLEFLNKIANIKIWEKSYNPYLINDTNAVKKDGEYMIKNSKRFRTLFIKTSIKHPLTIINHYLKSDALLWSPYLQGYVYIYNFTKWDYPYNFDSIVNSRLPIVKKLYDKVINFTYIKPIDSIFHRPANLMYLSILITIILSISLKSKKYYLILLPMFGNLISLLPINLAQDLRYVYINYLTFAFILLIFILNINKIYKYYYYILNNKIHNFNSKN